MPRILLSALIAAACVLPASSALGTVVSFRTPSGNIGCVGETARADNTVRCDIRLRNWSPPPRPRSCPLDWGQGLTLDRAGRARYVCAGDTALNTGRTLAYGTRRRIGGIVCVSRRTGLTCTNAAGHGFTMSRDRVRRF